MKIKEVYLFALPLGQQLVQAEWDIAFLSTITAIVA